MPAPNPDCRLCQGTGQMQSATYDGRPLIPCECTEDSSARAIPVKGGQAGGVRMEPNDNPLIRIHVNAGEVWLNFNYKDTAPPASVRLTYLIEKMPNDLLRDRFRMWEERIWAMYEEQQGALKKMDDAWGIAGITCEDFEEDLPPTVPLSQFELDTPPD